FHCLIRRETAMDLLDMSIVLTPPPPSSEPEANAIIGLRCDQLDAISIGKILTDPLRGQDRELLRWYLEEYWQWPYEGFRERGKRVEALLPELGKRLYKAVFGSREEMNIWKAWWLLPG